MVTVLNEIIKSEGPLYIAMNAYRQYVYSQDSFMGGEKVEDFFHYTMDEAYLRIRGFEKFKAILKDLVDESKLDVIDNYLFGDACKRVNTFKSKDDCYKFLNGVAEKGLSSIIFSYLVTISTSLVEFNNNRYGSPYLNSSVLNQICNSSFILDAILEHFAKILMKELRYLLIERITEAFNEIVVVCLGVLIGYLALVVVVGIGVWGAFLLYLRKVDLRVKQMLAIIPVELILRVKKIQSYFETVVLKA
eukprot:TRINITY_DN10126_c0_g5_i1.p1 TRINITY_DN10126_c0_g5~~TRINITY_DN10126_c0_g5_i1.p1  ORF type:complete len:248 (+),score=58.74 TRINITY_DN10126_c0_g5_i1:369-1112(+)